MPKSLVKLEKCQPSTSSMSIPVVRTDNGRTLQTVFKPKPLEFNLTRHEKLVKLSKKAACQVNSNLIIGVVNFTTTAVVNCYIMYIYRLLIIKIYEKI